MVKVTLRKGTKHLTPVEKLLSLERHRHFNRNRVYFFNRRENLHLAKRHHGYEKKNSKRMRDITRTKDQMKLNLIDLDYSRRRAKTICEYEKRLRAGQNSPVFVKEHMKLLRKGEELSFLQDRLNGPNSQIVAKHLREELNAINYRIEIGSSSQRIDQNAITAVEPSDGTIRQDDQLKDVETRGNEIEGAVLEKNMDEPLKKLDADSEKNGMESANVKSSEHQLQKRNHDVDDVDDSRTKDAVQELTLATSSSSEQAELRSRGDATDFVPLLSRTDSFFPITSSLSKRGDELPPLKVNARQPHCHFVVHRSHRPRQTPLSPTFSARKRVKHAQRRVTELTEKTKEDVKKDEGIRRRSDLETPRDSLKGIRQAETIARLKVAKKGITLPDIKSSTKEPNNQMPRSRTMDRAINLPALKVDRDLLSELKRQRYKHRNQSESLPQLP